jgi:putative flavoprotein involved in K+ transport
MQRLGEVSDTDVVVIGAGQAGLSVGYHLQHRGIPFVILDANDRVGDTWRKRWDSLRLFSPARFDGLAGMPFPAPKSYFPTKDEMADFLEHYAKTFALPVESGVKVDRVSRRGENFVVQSGEREITSRHVVVAMSNFQQPSVPNYASKLDPSIVQLHSMDYRNPKQLRDGRVLIVGVGNSGAEIAWELIKRGRKVTMSGNVPGVVPFRPGSFLGRHVFAPLTLGVVFHRVLTLDSPLGRKVHASSRGKATPLIRVKPKDLVAAGVERVAKVRGAHNGLPILENGETVDAANVIWCTGFRPGFSWIDLPVFDADGQPIHARGVVEREPGLYFTGLHFLYALSSAQIQGADRDASHVVSAIARRHPGRSAPPSRRASGAGEGSRPKHMVATS